MALNLTVTSLIGLILVDIAFVFWSADELGRERVLALKVAAMSGAQEAATEPITAEASLARLAARDNVELTLVSRDGSVVATHGPAPLVVANSEQEHVVLGGYDYVTVDLPVSSPYSRVIAARRLDTTISLVLGLQRPVLLFFAFVAAVMVLFGSVFLRRTVVRPITRMTELVSRTDRAGLMQLGVETPGGLALLSQAIIGMTQRIDTDRQRIAGQLAELTRAHAELRATQEKLVRAERLAVVGQLAAGLAHEIGNPLTVIIGFIEVLKSPGLSSAEVADALSRMSRELDRIHHTVRDLLDFSRVSAKPGGVGDVGEVLDHVHRLLAPQERLRGVNLEFQSLSVGICVPIDAAGLTQVLLNLLLNAADAVAGRGRIKVSAEVDRERVRVDIEDSGPGVPDELRTRIFEPFFSTKPAGQGTGLGLAVCESIVTAAGGEIVVGRGALGGARFSVTLPVAQSLEPTESR